MASIVSSGRVRAQLEAALQGVGEERDPIEAVGRLARLSLQQALEDELTELLGRRRYERTGAASAHRNGYEPTTVKTTAGPVELSAPGCEGRARWASRASSSARASRARTRSRRS